MNTLYTTTRQALRNGILGGLVALALLVWSPLAQAGDNNGSSSAIKIVYTYSGKVYTGVVLREITQGYLFRLVENKTIVIPFEQIKKIRNLHEKKAYAPAARRTSRPRRASQPRRTRRYRDLRPRQRDSQWQDSGASQDQDAPRTRYRASYRPRRRGSVFLRAQYREQAKNLTGPLLLNIFLPFAIGSWVAKDYIGGGIGVGAQLAGGFMLALGSLMYNGLPLAIPGMLLYLTGYAVPIGTVVMHVRGHNTKLQQRLGLAKADTPVGSFSLPRVSHSPVYQGRF